MEHFSSEVVWIRAWAQRNNLKTESKKQRSFECNQLFDCNVSVIPIYFFIPPKRAAERVLFCERRLKRLFVAMQMESPLPPIDFTLNSAERGIVRDGFHRFYLSVFFDFDFIPSRKIEFWEPEINSIEVLGI